MKRQLLMKKLFTLVIAMFIGVFAGEQAFAQSTPCTAIGVDLTDALQCPHSVTTYSVSNSDPTDGFENPGCGFDGTRAVWVAVTIPADATELTLTMDDSWGGCQATIACNTDGTAQIYSGPDCNNLTTIAGGDCIDLSGGLTNSNNTPFTFTGLTGGATYWIRITEEDDQGGDFPFTFSTNGSCPPCPTDVCNVVDLVVQSVTLTTAFPGEPAFANNGELVFNIPGLGTYYFELAGSHDGGTFGASAVAGTYTFASLACEGTQTLNLGQSTCGQTSFSYPNVSAWEEDGCDGDCTYGTGFICNDDEGLVQGLTFTPDISMPTGSFDFGNGATINYDIVCTPVVLIQDGGAIAGACVDPGTDDPADDEWSFTLNPSGIDNTTMSGLSGSYTATVSPGSNGITSIAGTYGAPAMSGTFLIADGPQTITVEDDACCSTYEIIVTPPAACSVTTCDILPGTWTK